jgi:aspartate aminotransferase-like enzyme
MFANDPRLRIPGPTPIPPRVQQAMLQPMIGHRSAQFSSIFESISERIKPVFGTKEDVFLVAGTGTSGLEMAVANTVNPEDEVIVIITGNFGERFAKIAKQYGAVIHTLEIPWGEACTAEQLQPLLQSHPKVKAVFATYCETSTGVLNPIESLAGAVRAQSDALFIVDAVSCLGAVPCEMDQWGLDIVVTGSQKAFMLPTGLCMIAVSDRAWKSIEQCHNPRFYLDLKAYKKNLAKNTTPYTPAISILFGLNEALSMMEEEGLDQIFKRHELMKNMCRSAIKALGLPLMTTDKDASPTVTSVYGTESFDCDELRGIMRKKYNTIIAGGQQHLTGKIIRIGHMGYSQPIEVISDIAILEMSLKQLNVDIPLGAGVKAAQEVLLNV